MGDDARLELYRAQGGRWLSRDEVAAAASRARALRVRNGSHLQSADQLLLAVAPGAASSTFCLEVRKAVLQLLRKQRAIRYRRSYRLYEVF